MILKLYNIKAALVAKCIALKRRIVLLFNKEFNPYPKIPHGMSFSPSEFQAEQIKNLIPKLNLKDINLENYKKLQSTTRKKIEDLTGLNKNLNFKILKTKKYVFKEKYIRKRIYVSLGKSRELPIDLLYKNTLNKAKGVMICMQGTNSGAHLSFGEILSEVYVISKWLKSEYNNLPVCCLEY